MCGLLGIVLHQAAVAWHGSPAPRRRYPGSVRALPDWRFRFRRYPCRPSHTKIRTGWTVGGGLEAMISSNWSIKGEYLFVDLGNSENYKVAIPVKVDYHTNILRLGVNYRF
ncbi:MAG: porin family protein [Deltaproteobacteria bacterium]|nr:MAG: porin family protein [Deltaproteobacteria bacterium]